MAVEYDVSVWEIKARKNSKGKVTSYRVRWRVGTEEFYESFKVKAQADSFRSDLISAQNKGEPFDSVTGLPPSLSRTVRDVRWFDLACEYVDLKWDGAAATARQTMAEALIRVTPVFLNGGRGRPSDRELRSVLRGWAFNTQKRQAAAAPDRAREVMTWCSRNSRPVSSVLEPDVLRALQKSVVTKLDGTSYAPTVARKTRSILSSVLDYAVEQKSLESNPLSTVKWTSMPKGNRAVDPRAVPNPIQARTLLAAVRTVKRSGARLEGFFGAMYFAALRPEEAVALKASNLRLPKKGWGEIYVEEAHPHAGRHWTGTEMPRDVRGLKARNRGEGRSVPCPPELVALLRDHIDKYGIGANGFVFTGDKEGQIPLITYTRVWRAARAAAFTEETCQTPLRSPPRRCEHLAGRWRASDDRGAMGRALGGGAPGGLCLVSSWPRCAGPQAGRKCTRLPGAGRPTNRLTLSLSCHTALGVGPDVTDVGLVLMCHGWQGDRRQDR